jgi:hypothetical protein
MRMTIRPKKPKLESTDIGHLIEQYLKKNSVPKSKREELRPAIALFAQQRQDLSRVQTNNIRACDLLHKYLEQVTAVGEAFQIGRGGMEVTFAWHDSFSGKDVTTQKCLAFEQAALHFNLAAMLTALAADQSRNELEGLKRSFQYFTQAAAIFSFISAGLSAELLKPISADLSVEGLQLCHSTCAAQAQECFYERSVKGGASPGLLAKIAAGVVQGYKRMASASAAPQISDALHDTWGIFARFNVALYTGEMEYRMASHLHKIPAEGAEVDPLADVEVVDEAHLKLGDSVARLTKARNASAIARKELDKFLRFVKDPDLERKLGQLNKDVDYHLRVTTAENDTVYFQKVPEAASLPDLLLDMKEVVKEPPIEDVLRPFSNHDAMPPGLLSLIELGRAASTPDVAVPPPAAPAPAPAPAPMGALGQPPSYAPPPVSQQQLPSVRTQTTPHHAPRDARYRPL